MKESKTLEFKREVTNTFLKTVSAFANYDGGDILFGVDDEGKIVGVPDPEEACLNIENAINDSFDPRPRYTLSINETTAVITLRVEEGSHKPYFYKSKAYVRHDTATVEVDRFALKRLILEGENLSFEELPSERQELTFENLKRALMQKTGIETFSSDTLKTLELLSENQFNIAAELLADSNGFPGLDVARFGDSINIILDRETFEHASLLVQYENAIQMFLKYYTYEEISGAYREKKELIPEMAFREAVANALVHRTWDIKAHSRIAMFPDRIEITSVGGLPKGISKEEYLRGGLSVPRNRILANVFLRLKMIERFGTGIKRINDLYSGSARKPTFNIMSEAIQVTLPVLSKDIKLSSAHQKVYDALSDKELSSGDVVERTGFGKNKAVSALNDLVSHGYIQKRGTGRGIRYFIK